MRIRVRHETQYFYDQPAAGVIQNLRLTPRNHDGQYIVEWRLDISTDCRVEMTEDAFGNIVHSFNADGPLEQLGVTVEGQVETQDANGIVREAVERFPAELFLRETSLTAADENIVEFARAVAADGPPEPLPILHRLLDRLHETITYDTDPTHVGTSAAEAFTLKRGVCQDLTHVYIAAARTLGIPARYIGGYFRAPEAAPLQAGHAWAEAFVPDLGWIAFDPTHGVCPTDAHVRIAVGLDYLGAAPVRGTRYGGNGERLTVRVSVEEVPGQSQWQSQS
jgi:transglutaminase-like putative cysteine protease